MRECSLSPSPTFFRDGQFLLEAGVGSDLSASPFFSWSPLGLLCVLHHRPASPAPIFFLFHATFSNCFPVGPGRILSFLVSFFFSNCFPAGPGRVLSFSVSFFFFQLFLCRPWPNSFSFGFPPFSNCFSRRAGCCWRGKERRKKEGRQRGNETRPSRGCNFFPLRSTRDTKPGESPRPHGRCQRAQGGPRHRATPWE